MTKQPHCEQEKKEVEESIRKFPSVDGMCNSRDALIQTIDQINRRYDSPKANVGFNGIPTGCPALDSLICGWNKGSFNVIAGRPSVGKTSFALNTALVCAEQSGAVALFSMEMEMKQCTTRILSIRSDIETSRLMTGNLSDPDFEHLVIAADGIVQQFPICIDDSAYLTVDDIRQKCHQLKKAQDLSLIIVDYLQMVQGGPQKTYENRYEEISDISRSLKRLAKELEVPVIALSYLSRSVDMRPNKRPCFYDLRGTGTLDEDADVILMLYREKPDEAESDLENYLNLIIAKNRFGSMRTLKFYLQPDTGKVSYLVKKSW